MFKKIVSCFAAIFLAVSGAVFTGGALTPAFEVTEIYKSSIYYEKLCKVELTGDQRRDIVNVAISQLGYHEGSSKKDFDGMNWQGNSNYTEYNYANRSVYSNGNTYSYAWCASFVTWCARQAGIPVTSVINSVSCDSFVTSFKNKSLYKTRASGYRPVAGDLIFFLSSGAKRQYASHVGIVVGTDSSRVYTIEGNTSRGIVNYRSYSLGDTYIVGYATPSYTGTNGNYSDFELKNGYVEPGEYKVTSASLNLRASYTSSSAAISSIPKNTVIIITDAEGDFGKTSYNGKEGWVSLKHVTPHRLTEYIITYNANGGEASPNPTKKTAGKNISITEIIPHRTGYDFIGWSRIAGSDTIDFASGDTYDENSDMTLYAVWKRSEITVSFLDYDNSVISVKTYLYGDEIDVPQIPADKSDGEFRYTFSGWDKTLLLTAKTDRTYTATYEASRIELSETVPETDVDEDFIGQSNTDDEQESESTRIPVNIYSSKEESDENYSDKKTFAVFDIASITFALLVSFIIILIKRRL